LSVHQVLQVLQWNQLGMNVRMSIVGDAGSRMMIKWK
jgi:hypothetical protein